MIVLQSSYKVFTNDNPEYRSINVTDPYPESNVTRISTSDNYGNENFGMELDEKRIKASSSRNS